MFRLKIRKMALGSNDFSTLPSSEFVIVLLKQYVIICILEFDNTALYGFDPDCNQFETIMMDFISLAMSDKRK